MRVLLVEDHPIVRQGIRQVLAASIADVDLGEAGDVDEALSAVRDRAWDVVVMDLSLPGVSGLEAVRQLHRDLPALPILIFSMHPAAQFAHRALSAGAASYLTKDSPPGELVEAVRELASGRRHMSVSVADTLRTEVRDAGQEPHESLSDREYQVLRMIASGHTVSQIAAQLSLSIKTVSTYRMRLLEKMRMRTNAELTHYAVSKGLIISGPLD
jgi:DNA-binding NarL/FixJ family response regulator